ncbi:MAG: DUF4339 domain-containing protein [Chlamydiota bacterium]
MKLLLTLLIVLTISYLTSNFAAKRGRDRAGWFILGFFFGIFAMAAVLILPPLNKKDEEEQPQVKSSDLIPPHPLEPIDKFADHQWHFIDVNGKQKGPVDIVDVQIAWDDGLLRNDCFVWHEGMGDWRKIVEIIGLEARLRTASIED